MTAIRLIVAGALVLVSTAAVAQTHAEMLERGIFSEDTAGDLPGAIELYEQLLDQPGVSRDVVSRARARLNEARRKHEQAVHAGSPAMRGVHHSSPVRQGAPAAAQASALQSRSQAVAEQVQAVNSCCGRFSANYDPGRSTTVQGTVKRVEWANPLTTVYVTGSDGAEWGFTFASPNTMIRTGWNRNTLAPGQQVTIFGYLALGTGDCAGALPHACTTLQHGALHASASTLTLDGKVVFDRFTVEMEELKRLQDVERQELERAAQPAQ